MTLEPGLNSYGFHKFLGREILSSGTECFVSLDLTTGGSTSYGPSIKHALNDLCHHVERGLSVLLYHSPGCVGPREVTNFFSDTLKPALERSGAKICGDSEPDNRKYILAGRKYEPFKEDQMKELRELYEAREDMKKYPSPFEDQVLCY